MSRNTAMKGIVNEAYDENDYLDDIDEDENQNQKLTIQEETTVQNIQNEFSNQISDKIIIDVLDSEQWDEDITRKILTEALEIYSKYIDNIKLQKVMDIFYDNYWNKQDTIVKVKSYVDEKIKNDKRKKENEEKKLLKLQKNKSSNEDQNPLQLQHKNSSKRKGSNGDDSDFQDPSSLSQSKSNINHQVTRKESKDIKLEKDLQKKLQVQNHSIKIERFEQETNKSLYNKVYPDIDHGVQISKDEEKHSQINLVTVGHVDSGKSTLVGHLRHLVNDVDKREMHKIEKASNNNNKQSFKYAYCQDEYAAERERGVTVDVGFKTIKTSTNEINFLDSPGHRDFVPNMISGTAQADYAMLVVDSGPNSFEAGFERGGQTKEHAYLIKAFGVDKVIVAVNKMDLHQWDKSRYTEVVQKVMDYLFSIGYQSEQVRSIPLAAFSGQNITKKYAGKEASWYTGPCLLQLLENLKPPKRAFLKPLRLNVYSAANKSNITGISIQGKMEGGIIKKGDKIICQPHGIIAAVKELYLDNHKIQMAKSGDNIEAQIQLKHDTEERYLNTGNVICGMKQAIPITQHVVIEFVAFDLIYPILKGAELMVYINTARSDGTLHKICKLIDKDNASVLKKNPKCIKSHECAEIQIKFGETMCAEIYSNFKIYGRVILRDNKQTIGVGTIQEIL